jgi:hypothetical protein
MMFSKAKDCGVFHCLVLLELSLEAELSHGSLALLVRLTATQIPLEMGVTSEFLRRLRALV